MTLATVDRASRHTLIDNLQGQCIALTVTAFGLSLLRAAGLVTGQTAGLALIVSITTGWAFGLMYFLVNLPFYAFAVLRMGWRFALRSFIIVALISVLIELAPMFFHYDLLNPYAAAVVAGLCAGLGVLGLFRHGATSGGFGIMAYYLQEKFGIRAGWSQLFFDAIIFAIAVVCLDPAVILPSFLGAVVLNVVVALNHRRDWYVGH